MEYVKESAPSILVIEDTEVSAEYLRLVLSRRGFDVVIKSTVASGLEAALRLSPDLILLDVLLPDGDGFSLCERMKAEPSLAHTPIVFVTSLEDVESRVRGLSIGAVDFISKPFAAEEVIARVRIHVKIARQARKLADAQSDRLAALRSAQLQFLTNPGSLPEAKCAVRYESAEEAGGDQYDFVELGTGIVGYLVADVAGHGIENVFQTSALKALFRENASVLDSPSDTLYMMNRSLKQHLADGQHLTAFYLILNRRAAVASYACAGHLPALAVEADGRAVRLSAEGDVLGAFAEPQFRNGSFPIQAGSRFWLYTDGMLENFRLGQSWLTGLKRLEKAVIEHRALPLEAALKMVEDAMVAPGPGEDDRILMAVDA